MPLSRSRFSLLPRAAGAPLVVLAVAAGCVGARAPAASSLGVADGRRRPDGVAVDPASQPPPPRERASATDGLVTLRAPLGVDRALHTVRALFRRIVQEDGEGLEALFARDATVITVQGPQQGSTPSAALWWEQRFRRLDYTKLAGELLYREADLRIVRAGDAADAPVHPAIHPETLAEGDVVVHVPIVTSRVGADRLLGDEMVLWLRRDGDQYKIYRLMEDFQLP
jgi:hypothetical protein